MLRFVGAALAAILIPFTIDAAVAASIPHDAARYQRDLTRNARLVWGMDAPVSVFAAQIHQESHWRTDASSVVGAQGMAQFMPATATWISGAYQLGEAQPNNPAWAMRALATYDKALYDRASGHTECDRMAKALWGYNGGEGWVKRDERRAAKSGADVLSWLAVEPFNSGRAPAMFAENRGYPRNILLKWQPIYALWGGGIAC